MTRSLNPQLWYSNRQLDFAPVHFTKCSAPITNEALIWVQQRLVGRYVITFSTDVVKFVLENKQVIYFEDPAEAMMYELRWSGQK